MDGERTLGGPLPFTERRWLHDKYEKLAEHEAQLADYRASYFAVLNTALVAGAVLVVINLLRTPLLFGTAASLLAVFGASMSLIWTLMLRRTLAAQNLWRDAALALETGYPPVTPPLLATVPGPVGTPPLAVDLARPYHIHRARFSRETGASYLDALQPAHLWADIPVVFLGSWLGVLAIVWLWLWLTGVV